MTGADGATVFFAAEDFADAGAFVVDAGFFAGGVCDCVCAREIGANAQAKISAAEITTARFDKYVTRRGCNSASELESMDGILLLNWLGRVGIFAKGFRIALAEHFHHPMIKIIDAMTKYRLKPAFIFFACLPDFIF